MKRSGHVRSDPETRSCLVATQTLRRFFALGLIGLVLAIVATTVVQAQEPASALPPFRADTDLPSNIVLNAEQGLGQCHWIDPQLMSSPLISWAYDTSAAASGWAAIEPQEGIFNWERLDAQIAKAHSQDKHIWIELLTSEGQTPQWAIDAGVQTIGSRGGTPVSWNETYQRLLRKAVHALAERYDDDPTVDAVNVMAGGCYGELAICAAQTDSHAWEQAGYTDAQFIEAAKQILDIYLEDEHQWEDGSTSHGFRKTPVVLQVGAGLYGHTTVVIPPVVEYAISKYGMRVWLKYNGYGGGYDMGWLYRQYDALTRVGYEPAGNNADFLNNPQKYIQLALEQHASYICLQSAYFDNADPHWQEARELAARYLGAQIVNLGITAPTWVDPGQMATISTSWENRGTVPLIRSERQGVKAVPGSYDIQIAFVGAVSGITAFEYTFTPAVPTTKWYSAQAITVEETIPITTDVPPGEYDLRIALVNPNLPAQDEQRFFHLVNTDQHDGHGRYTVGHIVVRGKVQTPIPSATATVSISPTPTASPTPPPISSGNWFSRLLQAFEKWLHSLLRVFQ